MHWRKGWIRRVKRFVGSHIVEGMNIVVKNSIHYNDLVFSIYCAFTLWNKRLPWVDNEFRKLCVLIIIYLQLGCSTKGMHNFNLENELCKIKIHLTFTELIKNPPYKNLVLKMNCSANSQVPSDTVNLQEENPKNFIGSTLAEKKLKMMQVHLLLFTLH